jgi:putative transposase
MRYRRAIANGGTYFFTLNLADRSSALLVEHVSALRRVIQKVRSAHPFEIQAIVVLPDHLHTICTLPTGDADYGMRWSWIKAGFSRGISAAEQVSSSRLYKRERGIWQRRYWEHQIRDERDLQQHVDYIHYNPVKHGYVSRAVQWPYSSLHRYVTRGWLTAQWGTGKVGIESDGGNRGER